MKSSDQSQSNPLFERSFKNDDGTSDVWKYDSRISTTNPVEVVFPKEKGSSKRPEYISIDDFDEVDSESLPKTKRTYLNPKNGKQVSYQRARNLGLI